MQISFKSNVRDDGSDTVKHSSKYTINGTISTVNADFTETISVVEEHSDFEY